MGMIAYKQVDEGKLMVWPGPVPSKKEEGKLVDAKVLFGQVKAMFPRQSWGMVDMEVGLCADPGVFDQTVWGEAEREAYRAVAYTVKNWSSWKIGAAKRALETMGFSEGSIQGRIHDWAKAYIKIAQDSYMKGYKFVDESVETTKQGKAKALRELLLRLVEIYSYAIDLDIMQKTLVGQKASLTVVLEAAECEELVLKGALAGEESSEEAFKQSTLFKLVNGKHRRFGRFGSLYSESIHGLMKEKERARKLLTWIYGRAFDLK